MCNDSSLLGILSIVKRIILLIQLVVPILLIIFATISFIKSIQNPEEKNSTKKIINQFLAATIVFFVPLLVNLIMNLVGEKTNLSSCWNQANDILTLNTDYNSIPNGDKRKKITYNSSNYENGEKNNVSYNLEHALQVGDYIHAKENAYHSWHGKRIGGYGGDIGSYTEAINILNETDYRIYEIYNTIISRHPEQANNGAKAIHRLTDVNDYYNIKVYSIDRNIQSIKQVLLEGNLVQAITDTNLFRNSKGERVNWSGNHYGLIFWYDGTHFHMKNSGSIRQKNAIYTEQQLAEWLNSSNINARPIAYAKK